MHAFWILQRHSNLLHTVEVLSESERIHTGRVDAVLCLCASDSPPLSNRACLSEPPLTISLSLSLSLCHRRCFNFPKATTSQSTLKVNALLGRETFIFIEERDNEALVAAAAAGFLPSGRETCSAQK